MGRTLVLTAYARHALGRAPVHLITAQELSYVALARLEGAGEGQSYLSRAHALGALSERRRRSVGKEILTRLGVKSVQALPGGPDVASLAEHFTGAPDTDRPPVAPGSVVALDAPHLMADPQERARVKAWALSRQAIVVATVDYRPRHDRVWENDHILDPDLARDPGFDSLTLLSMAAGRPVRRHLEVVTDRFGDLDGHTHMILIDPERASAEPMEGSAGAVNL